MKTMGHAAARLADPDLGFQERRHICVGVHMPFDHDTDIGLRGPQGRLPGNGFIAGGLDHLDAAETEADRAGYYLNGRRLPHKNGNNKPRRNGIAHALHDHIPVRPDNDRFCGITAFCAAHQCGGEFNRCFADHVDSVS